MSDPLGAVRVLHEHGVRFVLIGDHAARARGSSSVTDALAVCCDNTPDNLESLGAALNAMHACPRGFDEGEPSTFDTDFGAVDILATPSGTSGFADLASDSMDLGGFTVDVVALDDLIRMKRAAGRPKDRIEVEILVALRDEITGSS